MEKVTGIGGLFFRARGGDALARWYATHLGIDPAPDSYETQPWWQQAGPTVFTSLPDDSDHFGCPEQGWAINFRVTNLDAMVQQVRGAGIPVEIDPEHYPNGRFANLHDPEGNPIQLWQPEGTDASTPDASAA